MMPSDSTALAEMKFVPFLSFSLSFLFLPLGIMSVGVAKREARLMGRPEEAVMMMMMILEFFTQKLREKELLCTYGT